MFSRQQVIEPVFLNINQIVTNTEKMLRRLIKENIEFTVVLDNSLTRVKADPGQIEQIVLNLVVNARDAMRNGGKLRIQTRSVRVNSDSPQQEAGAKNGSFALLEVSDTGIGMDQQTQAHIFEPFFTTKGVGEGTGLGLATVYGIVKQSNGHIEVESQVGRGSTFKIYFPSAETAAADHETAKNSLKSQFACETVLVVEDAPALLGLIREALSASGCEVLSAGGGEEALRIVREKEGRIDLLLTDVVMPRMNGAALAKEVRALSPQAKILYMTGYSGEFVRADMLTQGVSFIQKPFTPAELGRKIRKMLADTASQSSAEVAPSCNAAKSAVAGSSR
jgi:two-component system cell cycle sensor histidine kinase/response regulator CckA